VLIIVGRGPPNLRQNMTGYPIAAKRMRLRELCADAAVKVSNGVGRHVGKTS
jgi:hypothetical protein